MAKRRRSRSVSRERNKKSKTKSRKRSISTDHKNSKSKDRHVEKKRKHRKEQKRRCAHIVMSINVFIIVINSNTTYSDMYCRTMTHHPATYWNPFRLRYVPHMGHPFGFCNRDLSTIQQQI